MPKAFASTVVDADAETVWRRIRDFGALADWHPGIADSAVDDGRPGDEAGVVRTLHLADGAEIRERLVSISDDERSYAYVFVSAPFPVQNYHSTIRVTPVTDGNRAFVAWHGSFDCDTEEAATWIETFGDGVYMGGLRALRDSFRT
ncbi:SRPBCC family protein [Marinivivus vitaminiproducens]|uniref:SRPBCC family protein n=1 Tax=Marinivivus vitaminiproducens TaxID=3035935 RepID=UPI002798895B|nr:SRPBCC family protein [Geminicoccaceae bacterium SCSIO 64248]